MIIHSRFRAAPAVGAPRNVPESGRSRIWNRTRGQADRGSAVGSISVGEVFRPDNLKMVVLLHHYYTRKTFDAENFMQVMDESLQERQSVTQMAGVNLQARRTMESFVCIKVLKRKVDNRFQQVE
ncbi:MAG: hypothetical protein Q9P90_04790 [candidate division KSB1 bacterium]|nr:hypothetical protein [candidate division KSB1 bacterium]